MIDQSGGATAIASTLLAVPREASSDNNGSIVTGTQTGSVTICALYLSIKPM